jgi:REP element-mobilizing transposase RayT
MTERLRRLDWVFERHPIYFITACVCDRRKILADTAVHEALKRFAEGGPAHGAWLGSYVLMPDHLHLFVRLGERDGYRPPLQLGEWMKSLKNTLSKALRGSGESAPHWQKGYFDHVLRSTESYMEKWHNVRDNPVRGGLVTRWEDWPYRGEPFPLEFIGDRA